MKRSDKILTVGLTVFVATLVWLWTAGPFRSASPLSPPARDVVEPGARFINVRASAEYLEDEIRRKPDAVANYVDLALVRLQQARETGQELEYVPLARRLIDQALKKGPRDYRARVVDVELLNVQHRFDEALSAADALLAEAPGHAYVLALRIDALIELGRYQEAVEASDELQSLRPGLPAYARVAYLRELHGDTEGALRALELAARSGAYGSAERAAVVQQYGNLLLANERFDEAEMAYGGILEELPTYAPAFDGFARVALVRGDYEAATALLEQGRNLADLPAFGDTEAELAGLVGTLAGDDARDAVNEARQVYIDLERAGENVDMEYADFLADEGIALDEAQRRIERERVRRPDHLHVLETTAWVMHRRGESAGAVPIIKRAMRLGTRDAKLYWRASQIAEAAGDEELADTWMETALAYCLRCESPSLAATAQP